MGLPALEDICNLALLRAGINTRIGSISDLNANAQACSTTATLTRQSLYTEFRWAFTIKRVLLTPYAGVAFDATHVYAKGDLTQYGDDVFRALQAEPAYAGGTTYGLGAVVSYNNKIYTSLQAANTGNQPDISPTWWTAGGFPTPDIKTNAAWWAQITRDGWGFCAPVPGDLISPVSMWELPTTSPTESVASLGDQDDDQDMLVIRAPTAAERQPFAIENANDGTDNEVILTDLDTPVLKYVADVTNTSAMHPKFVETYAWHMARDLALGLKNDLAKAKFCGDMAQTSLSDAFTVVMRDQQEDAEPPSEFEQARHGEI